MAYNKTGTQYCYSFLDYSYCVTVLNVILDARSRMGYMDYLIQRLHVFLGGLLLGNNTKAILRRGGHLARVQSTNGPSFKDFTLSVRSIVEFEENISLLTKV